MLESILNSWDEIETILRERKEINRLLAIDKVVAERLLRILMPFKKAIKKLESHK
jgi:hypothetical protein